MSVTPGVRYVVVAVDITGFESPYSNEVGEIISIPEPPLEEIIEGEVIEEELDAEPFESTVE
jgi:penicillin-binding protein